MTVLENILSQEIIQRLGWTLLHFIWQAMAVALLLAIMLRVMRKSTPSLRYILACLALGLIVLLPIVTMQLIPVSVPYSAVNIEPVPVHPLSPTVEIPVAETVVLDEPVQPEIVTPVSTESWKQRTVESLESALPYIVSGWLVGVFALSLWHLGGWAQLQRLRRKMVKQVDGTLHSKLKVLAQRLRVNQTVQLVESALVQIPTVVGWLRPVILLPASALTGLTSEQLEAILAHELAHIKRFDYLINILQTVVEILGFYHPAVWWVSHKIRAERENCCDDLAVSISGDRVCYARALTSMEEIRAGRGQLVHSGGLAVAATGGTLLERIRRLVGKDAAEKNSFSWIPAVMVILLLIALVVPTTLAITSNQAQNETDIQANKEETWGKAVEGVQVRLQTDKTIWKAGEVPKLKVDARNNGVRELLIYRTQPVCELSVDGQSYLCKVNRTRSLPLGSGKQYDGLEITLDDRWYSQGAYKALQLSPGKHTIQVTSKLDDARKGAIEPVPTPVIVKSKPVEIEILSNEEKNEVIAKNENLEILRIDFEPIHQGKNEVNVTIKNKTDKEQIFGTEILSSSPDEYGKHGIGWVSLGSFEVIQPQNTETVRFVYKIARPVNDYTWVWLIFYNPPIQEKLTREHFFAKRFYSGDLEHSSTEILDAVPVSQNQTSAVHEAFRKIQDNIRNQEYEKVWELFTEDYQKAEFHGASDDGFGIFKDTMEQTESGANMSKWDKREFLDLQPEKVSYHDGIFYLSANYNEQHWLIHFKMEDSQYKIDWIDGFTPRFLKGEIERQRVLSAENLKQLGLAVVMYADDHDNKLPDTLEPLKPYIANEQDYLWLLDNVEYALKETETKYFSNRPNIPVAYDKTQKEKQSGANVLFLDGHVEFLTPQRLSELDIKRAKFLIETWFLAVNKDFIENINHNADSPDEAKELFKLKSELLAALDGSNKLSFIPPERNVSLLLKAVRAHKDSKVLAAPQVICQEDKTAQIKVLNNKTYYMRSYFEPNRPSEKSEPKVEKIEEGITMSLKPKLTPNKNIDMQLELEIAQIPGFEERQFMGKAPYKPTKLHRTAQSFRYRVQNGQTLLFGGHKIADQQDGRTEQKDLLVLIKAETIGSSEQDKSVQVEYLTVAESGKTTSDVIMQPGIVQSRIVRRKDNEQESDMQVEDKSAEASEVRIVHFPMDRMVGVLKVRDPGSDDDSDRGLLSLPGWVLLGQAQGDVSVPAGKDLSLEIYYEEVADISFLADLKPDDLQVLIVNRETTDDDLVHIKGLTGLLGLDLGSTAIKGPGLVHLSTLTSLRKLSLFNTQVSDAGLAHLSTLKSLKYLNLYITQVKGPGLKHLKNLTSLISLDLAATPITNESLVNLAELTWLKQLEIYDTAIGNKGLANLKPLRSLEELILGYADLKQGYSPITDEGLVYLKELGSLKHLYLLRTRVTDVGLAHLRNLKKLEALLLTETQITGEGLAFLKDLPKLKYLDLNKTAVTDKGLVYLKDLKSLSKLYISSDSISKADLEDLEKALPDCTVNVRRVSSTVRHPKPEPILAENIPTVLPTITKSSVPSAQDKTIIQVDCLVVEVFSDFKMDRETTIVAENILGGKIRLRDTEGDVLLRKAAGATAATKDKSAENKRVTQEQFKALTDMLTSRGYMKILMNPRIQVVDGKTAIVKSTQHVPIDTMTMRSTESDYLETKTKYEDVTDSLEITPHVFADGRIILQVEATISSKSIPKGIEQIPIISKREISTRVSTSSGESLIIGGLTEKDPAPGDNVKNSKKRTAEVLFIITPTIITPATDSQEKTDMQVKAKSTLSAERLKQLGLAVIMYADDHDNKLPDTLEPLKPYIANEQDYLWLLDNVEYALKETETKYFSNRPNIPVAYDKTQKEKQSGANVLFLDGHVEFLTPQRLSELDIKRAKFLIETWFLAVNKDFIENINHNADSPDEAKELFKLKSELLAALDGSNKLSFIPSERNVSLLLKAVRAHKDSKVLAAPQVICQEDKTAKIEVMNNETYYIVGYTEPNSPSEKPQPKLEKVEEGIALSLRPNLTPNNNIDMQFEFQISKFLDSEERKFQGKAPYKPPKVQRTAQSLAYRVLNGQTLLFGGHKIADQQDGRTEQKDLLILIKAHTIGSSEQDKPAMVKYPIVTKPPRTTIDVITKPAIAKSRTERPEDNEQEQTKSATEQKPLMVQKIFKLKHHNSSQMGQIILPLVGEYGHISADERTNNLLVIDTTENLTRIEKIIAQFDVSIAEQAVQKSFKLKYRSPSQMAQILRPLLTKTGHVSADESTRILLLIDTPENLKRIEKIIAAFDVLQADKTVQKFFKLKYYSPSQMGQILTPLLSHTGGHISTDERTNSLLVIDTAENLMRLEKIIAAFDVSEAKPTVTEIFKIRYGDPVQIVELLKKLINGPPGLGSIIEPGKEPIVLVPEPRRKWIIAKASAENMKQIGEWIAKLDREEPVPASLEQIDQQIIKQQKILKMRQEYINNDPVVKAISENVAKTEAELIAARQKLADSHPEVRKKTVSLQILKKHLDERIKAAGKSFDDMMLPEPNLPLAPEVPLITNTFIDTDLLDVLKDIASMAGIVIIPDEKVVGLVTAELKDVPLDTALEIVLAGTPYVVKKTPHYYLVGSPENMLKIAEQIKEWDVPLDVDKVKPRIINLQNSDAAQMAELLRTIFAKEGGGGLNIQDILIDRGTEVKQKIVGPLYGQLTFEEVPGTKKIIVISKIPEAYDVIEQLILDLDRQEMTPEDMKQIGEWIKKLDRDEPIPASLLKAEKLKGLIETGKRVESAKKLSNLGKALLIYANDHEDKYPDSLHHLPVYSNVEELKWVLANVEYLAHGKTIKERPDTVIAYDKTLLAERKGTNVLFNDSHVEFVKPERLKELGITATEIQIETRLLSVSEDFLKDIGLDANSVHSSDAWSEHLVADSAAEPNSETYSLILDDLHISFLLKAVQAHKGAKMLTAPRATVWAGETATMMVHSTKFNYISGYTEPNRPSDEPEPMHDSLFKGIELQLTPNLTPDDKYILLDVDFKLSEVIGFEERKYKGKYPYHKPIVDVIGTETRTVVPDGATLLIGGLKITEQAEIQSSVPILSKLPLVGKSFRSRSSIKDYKMLLILVKPVINPQQKAGKILPGQADSEEHIKSLGRLLEKKLNPPAEPK